MVRGRAQAHGLRLDPVADVHPRRTRGAVWPARVERRGHRARRRRGIRAEDHAVLPRRAPGSVCGDAARPPGQVDGRPPGALHGGQPGARPGARGRGRLRRRRPRAGAQRRLHPRRRRLHAVRDHPADHQRGPAAGAVPHHQLPRPLSRHVHERHAHLSLPRRGQAPRVLRHGAHAGRDRAGAEARPHRGPPAQPDPGERVPVHRRSRLAGRQHGRLRQRQLPRAARPRIEAARAKAFGGPRRHGPRDLRRGHRRRPLRGRARAGPRLGQGRRRDRDPEWT